jgi:predicted acetyltransferase
VVFRQKPGAKSFGFDVIVSDAWATTRRAALRLWSFLASYDTMGSDFKVHFDGPSHPLLSVLPERVYQMELSEHWMVRLTDVKGAIELRGYSRALRGHFEIDIVDDVLPEQSGPIRVEVEGGRARVTPGGAGAARVDVRLLASMYTGFHTPRELVSAGALELPEDVADLMGGIFAGTPYLREGF